MGCVVTLPKGLSICDTLNNTINIVKNLGTTSNSSQGLDLELSDAPLDTCNPLITRIPQDHPATTRKRKGDARNTGNLRKCIQIPGGLPDISNHTPRKCTACRTIGERSYIAAVV